jgi:hypothetical protein
MDDVRAVPPPTVSLRSHRKDPTFPAIRQLALRSLPRSKRTGYKSVGP